MGGMKSNPCCVSVRIDIMDKRIYHSFINKTGGIREICFKKKPRRKNTLENIKDCSGFNIYGADAGGERAGG